MLWYSVFAFWTSNDGLRSGWVRTTVLLKFQSCFRIMVVLFQKRQNYMCSPAPARRVLFKCYTCPSKIFSKKLNNQPPKFVCIYEQNWHWFIFCPLGGIWIHKVLCIYVFKLYKMIEHIYDNFWGTAFGICNGRNWHHLSYVYSLNTWILCPFLFQKA